MNFHKILFEPFLRIHHILTILNHIFNHCITVRLMVYFQTFTRKKAFDFYIDEVKRDAHKLLG